MQSNAKNISTCLHCFLVSSSLVPRPPPFFVLWFAFSIIHVFCSSICVPYNTQNYTERKPKNKKQGRPGNKAMLAHLYLKGGMHVYCSFFYLWVALTIQKLDMTQ